MSTYRQGRQQNLTSFTTSIPPLKCLYRLKLSLCQAFRVLTTESFPSFFPAMLRTTHARGIFSSEVLPPETPATAASVINLSGCASRQFSISTGETCCPETLSISFQFDANTRSVVKQKVKMKYYNLYPISEPEISILINTKRIPRAQPPIFERCSIYLVVFPVSDCDISAP
jgi:hypothetical protein